MAIHVSHVFPIALSFRILNALIINTFFQPDEYFQALEPAWALAFGPNSGAYITWEWKHRIRSSLHPLLFAKVYILADRVAALLQLSSSVRSQVLIAAPKLLQAVFAALVDYFTWLLARKLDHRQSSTFSYTTLVLSWLSPWQFLAGVRTFSNCFETTLTIAALNYWPWTINADKAKFLHDLRIALFLAATAVVIRPTNLLIWLPLGAYLAASVSNRGRLRLLGEAITTGCGVLALSAITDAWFYGHWTMPALQFFHINLGQNIAAFYGVNKPLYYFTEALIQMLTMYLPFTLAGWSQVVFNGAGDLSLFSGVMTGCRRECLVLMAWTCFFTLTVLSLVSHKEMRFIYPVLPMLHIITGNYVWPWLGQGRNSRRWLTGLVICNAAIALYTTQVHQRGVIDVVHHIRKYHEHKMVQVDANATTSVGFLMPCHSTPWRSHLVHAGIEAWALTCEPPIGLTADARDGYLDEADEFYRDPVKWMSSSLGSSHRPWPEQVVFFANLEEQVQVKLEAASYRLCFRTFNSHAHDDWRRRGDVMVYCATDMKH